MSINNDHVLCAEERQEYRRRVTNLKLASAIFGGVGSAILFGLVATIVGATIAGTALPALGWGIGSLAVAGLVSIYTGTRFMLEGQMLDQELSAKMMGAAVSRGPAALVEEAIEKTAKTQTTEKPTTLPISGGANQLTNSDGTAKWADKVSGPSNADVAWLEKMQQAAETGPTQRA